MTASDAYAFHVPPAASIEAAAGITDLAKAVLVAEHGLIPAPLHTDATETQWRLLQVT